MLTRVHNFIDRQIETWDRHGIGAAMKTGCDAVLDTCGGIAITDFLLLHGRDLQQVHVQGSGFTFRFLDPDDVRRFAEDPANDLSERSVARISRGNDVCFAALTGNRLASYCWFALADVESSDAGDVPMSCPSHMAYLYKAYTNTECRGKRLVGAVIGLGFEQLALSGIKELIAQVHWTNYSSLRALKTIGFKPVGQMFLLGRRKRRLVFMSPRLKNLGIRFGKAVSPR